MWSKYSVGIQFCSLMEIGIRKEQITSTLSDKGVISMLFIFFLFFFEVGQYILKKEEKTNQLRNYTFWGCFSIFSITGTITLLEDESHAQFHFH